MLNLIIKRMQPIFYAKVMYFSSAYQGQMQAQLKPSRSVPKIGKLMHSDSIYNHSKQAEHEKLNVTSTFAKKGLLNLHNDALGNLNHNQQIQNSQSNLFESNYANSNKFGQIFDNKQLQQIQMENESHSISKINKNDNIDFINSLDKLVQRNKKSLKLRVLVKKNTQQKQFKVTQQSLKNAESIIFGNKKVLTQNIIFKCQQKNSNARYKNYGENWVYAYDLPYEYSHNEAKMLLKHINQKFGQISQFTIDSFYHFTQKSEMDFIYVVPDNYAANQQTKRQHIKIQRLQMKPSVGNKEAKKSKTQKILDRMKQQKQSKLNRSSMVFKFKNKADKYKFLNPQMRLYGLNFGPYRNIKFEEAQSKNMVVLSMIPWSCQSRLLIDFINQSLSSLNVNLTHPSCIIAEGFVFLELSNFYEAVHAKDLLNNLVFQTQRLKAQLSYGPSEILHGNYKNNFSSDYYHNMIQKITQIRNRYFKQYQES